MPEYVQCQVQHQLAVTGKTAADVCVLICGQEIKIHRIERDELVIKQLIELERQFWQYVIDDIPPPVDGSDSSSLALQCLYPKDTGHTVDCRDNEALSAQFLELVGIKSHINNLKKTEQQLKQVIQQYMGDATNAQFSNGYISYKRSKDRMTLNTQALLKEKPELLGQFPKVSAGTRRFLIKTDI